MPIEPTSVSNTSIREVEKSTPSFSLWTSKQGSSTGGKDSPNSSIWEKAISGAQKLLGFEKSEPTELEDSSDTEPRSDENATVETTPSFNGVPGFGSRIFGNFGGSAFGSDAFGAVSTSRTPAEMSAPTETIDTYSPRSEYTDTNGSRTEKVDRGHVESNISNSETLEESTSEDELEQSSESEKAKAKPAAKPQVALSSLNAQLSSASANLTSNAQATVATQSAQPAKQNVPATEIVPQAKDAKPTGEVASAINPQAGQAKGVASTQANAPVPASIQNATTDSVSQPMQAEAGKPMPAATQGQQSGISTAQTSTQTNKSTEGKVVDSGASILEKTVAESAKQSAAQNLSGKGEQTVAADAKVSKAPVATTASVVSPTEKTEQGSVANVSSKNDSLEFDATKAKEVVSETFARAGKEPATARTPVSQTPSMGQPTQAVNQAPTTESIAAANKTANGEGAGIRLPDTASAEVKDLAAGAESAKRDVQVSSRGTAMNGKLGGTEAAAVASGASRASAESVAVESKVVNGAQSQAASQTGANARETATAVASRVQAPVGNGKPGVAPTVQSSQTVAGTSGAGSTTATVATQGSRQNGGQQGGDASAKQELGDALKQTTTTKAADKSSGETSQSFDSKMESATASRRSEAASKTRQTSYVSKTADEVKEVVATLTKSIDRLVSTKPGTMNLKINFEGGGSLNLRVSMDGNQVSTSMQTDVAGLETAIKSNWSELANDWNQKGVKLNTPHFQNSENAASRGNADEYNEFSQRGDRNTDSRGTFGEGRGRSQTSQLNRGFASAGTSGESVATESQTTADPMKSTANQELKTYA